MLQKLNTKRSGFTLVEIMIVVSIIALLAAIAVPNALRARKRSQAASIVQTLRMIDSAKDQLAVDSHLSKGQATDPTLLAKYVKEGSDLQTQLLGGAVLDELKNSITIGAVDVSPKISTATHDALDDVLGNDPAEVAKYWGVYN